MRNANRETEMHPQLLHAVAQAHHDDLARATAQRRVAATGPLVKRRSAITLKGSKPRMMRRQIGPAAPAV